MDCSLPGFSVHGIFQARTLEWVAISFPNAWKWKVKVKSLSCVWLLVTPWTAAHQAPPSMGFSGQQYWSGVPLPSPSFTLEDRYFEVNIKEIKLKSRQVICQFHTNKCRSSINVHTFLVPTLFYMYWTFAVFAPTSISSFHHDFAVATTSFNSQLLSFRWSWMHSWLPKKSQFWPWLMAHFTSVTTVARSVMAMCFQPSQSGSRRYHSGLLGRQTSSCANEAITSRCVLVSVFEGQNIP